MYRLFLFSFLLLTGCNGCDGLKKKVGLGNDNPEPITVEEEKQKLEEEKKKIEEERVRLEEDKKRAKEQQLRDGDALVQEVANQLEQKAGTNGFPRLEGALELDPWGNSLKIEYSQEWFHEIATVRSAGPDGKMGTLDDIIRTRKTSNVNGILRGMGWGVWVVIIWVIAWILALLFSTGINHRRKGKGEFEQTHPFIYLLAVFIFAPFAFLVFGAQLVGLGD